MPTTRSKAKQTHLEDFTDDKQETVSKAKEPTATKPAPKRKAATSLTASDDKKAEEPPKKRPRGRAAGKSLDDDSAAQDRSNKTSGKASGKNTEGASAPKNQAADDDVSSVTINRAPVLHLYAACVTHFLHPSLPWTTCLSAGSAVSALCAMAKGRAIGVMSEPDPDEKEKTKKEKSKEKDQNEQLEIMHFKLRRNKDGLIIVGKDAKKADETALVRKYGGDAHYNAVRKLFDECLTTWEGEGDDLNGKAFGFYETFRPSVAQGQSGWGRKGELEFGVVREAVARA